MNSFWDNYSYTDPISQALTAEFGTEFRLENTGGGCICIEALLEGGYRLLVGCAVDGPLLREDERPDYSFDGGYGVGIYDDREPWTGETLAYAIDYQAETAADVIALVYQAMNLMTRHTEDTYVTWTRDVDGTESEKLYPK